MASPRGIIVTVLAWSIVALTGCTSTVLELKAARNAHSEALHEQISQVIHAAGFRHGVRSTLEDAREIDTILVALPLDSVRRRHVSLHNMLFNVGRLCARPEHAHVSIQIELNAGDEGDRAYLRSIVEPLVAEARNVRVMSQNDATNDFVITLSYDPNKPAAKNQAR